MKHNNAIVGQSGGPTAAINATLAGVIKGAGESEYIDKIYGTFNGIDGILNDNLCILNDIVKTDDDLELLSATPSSALGSCRKKLPDLSNTKGEKIYKTIFDIFEKYNIGYFFYIGGNDSMDTVLKLSSYASIHNYDINVMGVPKTIDNDVEGTDHTPGFGSAAKYIAASMQEILRDCNVYTVKAVTIVEIMGRDAGWLTASAAIPGKVCGISPDLIYLPERVFDMEAFLQDVKKALDIHPNVVVAVSEGIKFADGRYVGEGSQSGISDVFGHKYLSGTGKALEYAVKEAYGCKVRSVELNILQRCASHIASSTDIKESFEIGRAAVEYAGCGVTGHMMTFGRSDENDYEVTISSADINGIANRVRAVPDNFINERGNGVTDECIDYILPLIQGEIKQKYLNGLPCHFEIKK